MMPDKHTPSPLCISLYTHCIYTAPSGVASSQGRNVGMLDRKKGSLVREKNKTAQGFYWGVSSDSFWKLSICSVILRGASSSTPTLNPDEVFFMNTSSTVESFRAFSDYMWLTGTLQISKLAGFLMFSLSVDSFRPSFTSCLTPVSLFFPFFQKERCDTKFWKIVPLWCRKEQHCLHQVSGIAPQQILLPYSWTKKDSFLVGRCNHPLMQESPKQRV